MFKVLRSQENLPLILHSVHKNDVFREFSDSWEENWIYSEHPGKEFGKFVLSPGEFYNDKGNTGKFQITHTSLNHQTLKTTLQ